MTTPICQHKWRVATTIRFSRMQDGKNAMKVFECKACPAKKTENVVIGAAKMKRRA